MPAITAWGAAAGAAGLAAIVGFLLGRAASRCEGATPSEAGESPKQRQLARAYHGSRDGYWTWEIASGRVLFSDSFKQLLGFRPDEMEDRYEAWETRLHEEDREPTLTALERHLAENAPYNVEYRLRCRSGEYRWFRAHGQADRDPRGNPTLMSGCVSDVTRRKTAEAELKSSQSLYLSLVESLPVYLIRKDLAGRFTFCNQAFCHLLGKPLERILGTTDFAHFSPELAEKYRRDDQRVLETRTRFDDIEQTELGTRPGYFQVIKTPVLHGGETVGTQAIFWDVTDRKLAEQALLVAKEEAEQASRAKSDFVANISHEIRTPLNAIIGMAELVLETPLDPTQRDYLATILDSGESLLSVINQILDFSKMEARGAALERVPFGLRELVDNTMRSLCPRAEGKDLDVRWDVDRRVPDALCGDPGRLRQVLVNLVGNAIKFTEQGEVAVSVSQVAAPAESTDFDNAVVAVARLAPPPVDAAARPKERPKESLDGAPSELRNAPARQPARQESNERLAATARGTTGSSGREIVLEFAVRDTGIGIAKEHQREIFQPFQQADSSTTRKYGGTGLGLSIAVELVQLMGGSLGVTSGPGEGSTFHLCVPLTVENTDDLSGAGQSAAVAEAPAPQPATPLRVLVAEDGRANQKLVVGLLQNWGHQVRCAANGTEAIQAWQQESFDVILMDLQMPEVDGLQATRGIRQWENRLGRKPTPIIALTAHSLDGDRQKCLDAGMDDYLAKPLRQRELKRVLARFAPGGAPRAWPPTTDPQPESALIPPENTPPEAITPSVQGPHGEVKADGGVFNDELWEEVLQHAAGDPSLAEEVLRALAAELPGLLPQLSAALTQNQADVAQRTAHTVKGATRILSHSRVHQLAARIDEHARHADWDAVKAMLPEFSDAVTQLVAALEARSAGDESL